LAIATLLAVVVGIFGAPVAKELSSGGFQDPDAESSRAAKILTEKFNQGDAQLLILVTADDRFDSSDARAAAVSIVDILQGSEHVASVSSAWTSPPDVAQDLISRDRKSGLVVAGIKGDETQQQKYAKELSDQVAGDRAGVVVRAGGIAMVNVQITKQSQSDLVIMESIAVPLSFAVLVWVFGGFFAAILPIAVGVIAILGSLAVLRVTTFFTDVSIFALNLSTALGLALAVDYTLLMLSRYRDEVAAGADREAAVRKMMGSAGRTVLFSATTVALSMAAMALFPMYFLRSFAYAGVATVAFAALAAIVVTPAAIMALGDRVAGRSKRQPQPIEQQFWYRSTKFVMRRAIPIGLAGVALLLVLGAPFLGVRPGFPDDRVLPRSASSHQIGDELRTEFANDSATAVQVVINNSAGVPDGEISRYAAELSKVPDVTGVSAPNGTFQAGSLVGAPSAPTGRVDSSTLLTVDSSAALFSDASNTQLDRLHAVPVPGGTTVEFGGTAQTNADSVHAIVSRLPVVLGLIGAIMLVLLFLLTGSVVLPLKALLLNVLSLTAAFGALVWIFQEGHLGAFGTTPTGTLVANMPVLLFCIAFGLSMDYEVFLVSRIREFWLETGSNDESVALGVARTGRVITAAALIMAISFAALIAANVSFMRMFGVGLTLAVLADATLVRLVLVPAFMHVMGKWNWWSPKPLLWVHERFGFAE
jgi:RND superfamily putative drug exporter